MVEKHIGVVDPTDAVLRSCLRKLVSRDLFTKQDIQELLEEAALGLDLDVKITPEFAKQIATEDLMPRFFGTGRCGAAES
ncbi:hypothetical protein [Microvirga sp. 2TAF3]|uniref:hypothetical protein n=1 Tax=Microvirga sp. 2TAF3 TaxID=3233014 RepID=UPI003F9A63CF